MNRVHLLPTVMLACAFGTAWGAEPAPAPAPAAVPAPAVPVAPAPPTKAEVEALLAR